MVMESNDLSVNVTSSIIRKQSESVMNDLILGDCVEKMQAMPPGQFDLVFADPPFNIGYDYDVYMDNLERKQYLDWSRRWLTATSRVLKPSGTLWVAIGDEYAAELKVLSQEIGLHCRSWVIWYYTFGVNCKENFTRSHTHLHYFVKNPNHFTFNAEDPKARIPSARQLIYNDKRANPKGRLPDNTWILRPQELDEAFTASEDTWHVPRICGTFKERQGWHGCQMPESLLGRIIRLCSNPGDMVLDPFSGSATTLAVAKKLDRRFVGFEISEQYLDFGRERLAKINCGDPLAGEGSDTKPKPR